MSEKKVYGLILPKKGGQVKGSKAATATFNVFGDESDEEETTQAPVAPYGQGKSSSSSKMKRQTQMDIDKALQEDPNIYEYDEIYDEMQAQKPKVGAKEKESSRKDRQPKYIAGLLKAAEVKKREDERRKERQVQKEREAEGSKFADKESFVTSAYKKKMLEMQAEEERERQEAAMEALTDVTKQKDMSGFYRYLYRQTTGGEVKPEPASASRDNENKLDESVKVKEEPQEPSEMKADVKEEPASPASPARRAAGRRSRSTSSSSHSASSESDTEQAAADGAQDSVKFSKRTKVQASNQYRRKRVDSSSDSETSPQPQRDKSPDQRRKSPSPSQGGERAAPRRKRSRSRSRSPPAHQRHNKSPEGRRRKRSHSRSPVREKRRSLSRERRSDDHLAKSQLSKKGGKTDGPREAKSRRMVDSDGDESLVSNHISRVRSEDVDDDIEDNLKEMRKQSSAVTRSDGKENSQPTVDPAKKVYPHHNSAKDIEEAKRRYLQRKLARERAKMA